MAAGLVDAMQWLAANVPIYSANVLMSTAAEMWALRYPESNELYLLDRRDGVPPMGLALRSKPIRAHRRAGIPAGGGARLRTDG